jgi:mono/diheme cytochrome c family protein
MKTPCRLLALATLATLTTLAVSCGPSRRTGVFGESLRLTERQQRGQSLYMLNCNGCHPGGAGGLGPGLANKPLPGFAMRTQIRAGVGAMPAFTEQMLSDEEVNAIVDYVNALQETPGPL